MKTSIINHFLVVLLASGLFLSCQKEANSSNADILNTIPGGTITTTLTSNSAGSLRLTNDNFPSYGCALEERSEANGTTGYYINLRISGKKDDMIYFIKAVGSISPDQYNKLLTNPQQQFSVSNLQVQLDIRKGQNSFYTNLPGETEPGTMTLSNFGKIGDGVQITLFIQSSRKAGFQDMNALVNTRYVVFE